MNNAFDIDSVMERLLKIKPGKNVDLKDREIRFLIKKSKDIFMSQPMLLELDAPLWICGDVHGQFEDLVRIFSYGGFPPRANYLFLGDYVDRGHQSVEVICLLMCYKIKYPENFFLLRGNHECATINRLYGFFEECKMRYSIKLWRAFCDCFNCLPAAALVMEKVFCCHGGLSPDLKSMDQIKQLPRPVEVADQGLLTDLLWADPCENIKGWGENNRGVSFTFGEEVLERFLNKFGLDLVVRAHQMKEFGYELFGRGKLVTVFSAPNYCGEFDNAGAMMKLDRQLNCSFIVYRR